MIKEDKIQAFSIAEIREDFPILSTEAYGKPLVYFDNGATAQKPSSVIQAITDFYSHSNSNVHRGVHSLSQKATELYELARTRTKEFINAEKSDEIIFTKGKCCCRYDFRSAL